MRAWVKDNDMIDFTSMLTYTTDKFTPTGFLCYYKEKVDAETPTICQLNSYRNSTTSGGILHMS